MNFYEVNMFSIIRPLLLSFILVGAPTALAGHHEGGEGAAKEKHHQEKGPPFSHFKDTPVDEWPPEVQEHESTLLTMLKDRSSERYDALMVLRSEGGELYVQALEKIAKMAMKNRKETERRARREKRETRKAFKARVDAALDGYGDLNKREKSERRDELTQIADEVFTLRQKARRKHLASLEKTLTELQQKVAADEEDHESKISDWVGKKIESATEKD
jgi:hypothetical protein